MKSLFFGFILGLFSCTACTKPVTSHPCNGTECISVGGSTSTPVVESTPDAGAVEEVPVDPNVKEISGEWGSVTIPTAWTEIQINVEDGSMLFAYTNNEKHNLFFMGQEEFSGSVDEYSLYALKALQDAGGKVTDISKEDINGKHYTRFLVEGNDVVMWLWATVSNGNGYALSCGGALDSVDEQWNMCSAVVDTLHIK